MTYKIKNRKMKYNFLFVLLVISSISFIKSTKHLPKVLIIGDSIAGDYFSIVMNKLQGIAEVQTPQEPGNGGGTTNGLLYVDKWIAEAKWDVIHFNFGLHDIKHIDPETGKNSKNLNDPQQANPEQYGKNLRVIVQKLKASGAKLIFATTTPYPDKLGKQMRTPGMPAVYNKIAIEIMRENDIAINDIYSYVLPRMEKLQRPKNVHFTEKGYQVIGNEVAEIITKHITK
jgi:lysophospholipase L1-like esterase